MIDFFQKYVLFVDDDPAMLRSIRRLLHHVEDSWISLYAQSVDEALKIIAENQVDVVVTDVDMPEKSGFDLLLCLRGTPETVDLPVLIVTGKGQSGLKGKALNLGATDLLAKPVELEDLLPRIRNMLNLKHYQDQIKDQNRLLEEKVRERTRELEQSQLALIWQLAKAAECRDTDTGNHIARVAYYCRTLARKAGQDEGFCQQIFRASTLHDIGKIGIADDILLFPGRLSQEQRSQMEQHPALGAELLRQTYSPLLNVDQILFHPEKNPLLEMAADIALCHHECWDGSGYPHGLQGEAIPLAARICAIADVFDALTTKRPYKEPFAEDVVLKIMYEKRAVQFDPQLFGCFEESLDEFNQIKMTLMDD